MGAGTHEVAVDRALAFFGGVIAAQAHELRNVLNIINELAGLQQDLLAAGGVESQGRVAQLGARVQAQVERGRQILVQVSRFAHSVDAPCVVFDVGEVLGRVGFFAERVARLNRTSLAAELAAEPVAIENDPFALQQAVFVALQQAIGAATEARAVRLGFAAEAGGVTIWVRSADPIHGDDGAARDSALAQLLATLGGKILESPRQVNDDGWRLWVPSRSPGASVTGRGGR